MADSRHSTASGSVVLLAGSSNGVIAMSTLRYNIQTDKQTNQQTNKQTMMLSYKHLTSV